MEISIFWDITPSSPLIVTRRFGVKYSHHFQGLRNCKASNQHEAAACCMLDFASAFLFLDNYRICYLLHAGVLFTIPPWRWMQYTYVSPKRRLTFNGHHGVISQKVELLSISLSSLPELSCIEYLYPKWQGDPVIPPGTRLPFCRLLRLARLRWRYSNPPPHRSTFRHILLFSTLNGCYNQYSCNMIINSIKMNIIENKKKLKEKQCKYKLWN
jgi:hypothetical protein